VDRENGEFWASNPFMIPKMGENLSAYERNCVFLNVGGRKFINASFASSADIDADSRAVVAADFNRDGAADLLIGSAGGGSLRLFENRIASGNRVLRLKLVGTTSNRSAIGSRVTATVGDRKIVRDLFPADGFSGQSPAEMLMGVDSASKVDKLSIRWPDGKVAEFADVPVGEAMIRIREGESDWSPVE